MKYFQLFKFFFILWMVDYVVSETTIQPKYRITPLGHFGLLIKCEIPNEPKDAAFVAEYTIVDAETGGKNQKFFTIGDFLSKTLLNLTPDTKYKIEARVKSANLTKPIITILEAKTNKFSAEAPFKPDFTYKLIPELYSYSNLIITWLPCGNQYDCGAVPAGEHFYVKYQEKGNNTDLLINRKEFVDETYITGCRPGKVYKFTIVSVYGLKETESEPQEITFPNAAPDLDFVEVLVSENVTLPCKLPKALKSSFTWKYPVTTRNLDRFTQLDDGSLFIKKVTFFDRGQYVCHVPSAPTNTSFSIYLDIKEKTSIQNNYNFKKTEVKAGDPFEFSCIVKHDDTLALFVDWLKNGEPVDAVPDCEIEKNKNYNLVISKTTKSSSGNYTCIAKTRLNSVSATLTLNVV